MIQSRHVMCFVFLHQMQHFIQQHHCSLITNNNLLKNNFSNFFAKIGYASYANSVPRFLTIYYLLWQHKNSAKPVDIFQQYCWTASIGYVMHSTCQPNSVSHKTHTRNRQWPMDGRRIQTNRSRRKRQPELIMTHPLQYNRLSPKQHVATKLATRGHIHQTNTAHL